MLALGWYPGTEDVSDLAYRDQVPLPRKLAQVSFLAVRMNQVSMLALRSWVDSKSAEAMRGTVGMAR